MEDWILFVFKYNRNHFLVNAENEEDAWNQLQKRMSWSMTLIKERCSLIHSMNSLSNKIIKL